MLRITSITDLSIILMLMYYYLLSSLTTIKVKTLFLRISSMYDELTNVHISIEATKHSVYNLLLLFKVCPTYVCMNILASGNCNSGAVETCIPDTETAFDWLNYHPLEIEPMSSPEPLCGGLAGFILVRFLVF